MSGLARQLNRMPVVAVSSGALANPAVGGDHDAAARSGASQVGATDAARRAVGAGSSQAHSAAVPAGTSPAAGTWATASGAAGQAAPTAERRREADRAAGMVAPAAGAGHEGGSSLSGAGGGRRRAVPPKLYRIGEVVSYSGVSRQTIHNYTTMGLLRESCWTPGGHRLYDASVFERLDTIAELKRQRKSLRDIREHFARRERSDR